MNRPRLALLAVVAATAMLACATAAGAASSAETLKLTTVEASSKETANGFVFKEKVLRAGKQIGRDRGVCTYRLSDGEPTGARCRITVFLPDGRLILRATVSFDKPGGRLAVVGGTGAYEGARGTGTHRTIAEGKTRITIRLR